MTSTERAAQMVRASKETALRASVAALSPAFLARIGLDSPEKIEAYIKAEVADL